MQTSRNRRHRLTAVAMVAAIGLGANGLAAVASSGSHRVQSLGAPNATTSSLPAAASPAACVTAGGCDLWAHHGTVTAGSSGPIDVWGFTFNPAADTGELGGSVNNTIVISETDTLTINLHNDLPAGAGNLSLEVPAAQQAPDSVGVAVGANAQVSFGPLAPGTYVYEAGSLAEQPRQLAMGLAAIIVVRPSDYGTSPTPYGIASSNAFADEALVVMNEIDPTFSSSPLTSDVESYNPQYFFINGKAHPATTDIAANAGDAVLLRVANLGIRDRSLGLLNLRMTVVGDDSQQVTSNHQTGTIESKLLTPGQVADVTTIVDPSSTVGKQFPVLDLSRHLNNSADSSVGGMLTFIDVVAGPAPAGGSVARVTDLSPATNDGTQDVAVDVTFSGGPDSAAWFLDTIDGVGHPFAAGDGSTTVTIPISDVLAEPGALTGDHVIWIQPYTGAAAGTPSGDVFTLAKEGPSISSLATDPHFANVVFNKVDPNPPGNSDVLLTGSAQPSLVDYVIDGAEACFTLPAPTVACPAPPSFTVDVADALVPSHTQALSARIPVSLFPSVGANTVYLRVHESPTAGGADRYSDWSAQNSVGVVIDKTGPAVTVDLAHTDVYAGAGNNPGNLNFLESIRVQVNIADDMSPIADAELFLDTNADPSGTGSQLRPLPGQWLDNLNATTRTAYLEIPVSELLARPQGNVSIYIHAKDAAGNWGAYTLYAVQLDKTNPVTVAPAAADVGSHTYMPDETGAPVLAGGRIRITSCDPNGVTADPNCPLPAGTALLTAPNTPLSSRIVSIRYHVSAVTGTIGTVGAGIFYQTAQTADLSGETPVTNADGSTTWTFNWHMIQPSAVPIDGATSVWVWVIDGAGNPSIPVEVMLGP
ncbi:MAG: hypothetical protein ABJD24_02125 [Acidimicrobiales bacterium]